MTLTEPPEATSPIATVKKMRLQLIFEDDSLMVVNKPAGVSVHPSDGSKATTLVEGFMHHLGETLDLGLVALDPMKPGVVHRLTRTHQE